MGSASWDRKGAPSLEWQAYICLLCANIVIILSGFSSMAGGWLKNQLLRVLSRLLFQEIEDGVTGTRSSSRLLLNPSRLLQNFNNEKLDLVLSSNIRLKGDKMRRENNPIRLPLETWCSLSVPQCTASNKAN